MTAIERIENALAAHGSVKRGGNWNCPAHPDSNPSLHITSSAQGVGFKCHGNCDKTDVLDALGLTWSDMFEETERREVARYKYTSADGEVLFAKVRFEPKGFSLERWEDGGWEHGLNGSEKPVYRLPQVLAAVAQGRPVWVVNGEKSADRLAGLGITATCTYDGEGKWKPEYGNLLKGADVTVVADRDDTGVKHARMVREDLRGKAASVRLVQSATTGSHHDVADHLDAGFGLDQLVPLGSYRPVRLTQMLRDGIPEPVMLAGDFLYSGGLHSIAGPPDCGKTTIALCWVLRLLKQGHGVIFLDEEGGADIVTEKLAALGAVPADLELLSYLPFPGRSWIPDDVADLTELAEDLRPALMLWDSSAAFLARAGLDENSASDVTKWWGGVLTPIARDLDVAMLVIDHDSKSSESSRYARGSGAKLAALDAQFKVEMVKPFSRHEDGTLKLNVTKDRRGHLSRFWRVEIEAGEGMRLSFFRNGKDAGEWSPAKRKVWGVLTQDYQSTNEIREQLAALFPQEPAMARETVSRELNDLLHEGRAGQQKHGPEAFWRKIPQRDYP
jgi:hypothetical protein